MFGPDAPLAAGLFFSIIFLQYVPLILSTYYFGFKKMEVDEAKKKKYVAIINIFTLIMSFIPPILVLVFYKDLTLLWISILSIFVLTSIYYIYFTINRIEGKKYVKWQGVLFGWINISYFVTNSAILTLVMSKVLDGEPPPLPVGGMTAMTEPLMPIQETETVPLTSDQKEGTYVSPQKSEVIPSNENLSSSDSDTDKSVEETSESIEEVPIQQTSPERLEKFNAFLREGKGLENLDVSPTIMGGPDIYKDPSVSPPKLSSNSDSNVSSPLHL